MATTPHTAADRARAARHSRPDDGTAFLKDPMDGRPHRSGDDLAELLGEHFVESATSAEEAVTNGSGTLAAATQLQSVADVIDGEPELPLPDPVPHARGRRRKHR